ncbi:MAG: molybdenum cofactor guanylyltransferase [Firmicutes bacterium]|jgi:molybdopterin-guanine dinucleotide biosynthesis protein A|nr:molybdenum cofactor guanylyltransferase [Bacillota bacterium]
MKKSKLPFTAVLLAGGESKRMGMDKVFLKLGKERLIDLVFRKLNKLFAEVIIVTDRRRELSYLPANITEDLFGEGPKCALRGIHAGLSLATNASSFIVGCDMPFISPPLIRYMSRFALEFDVVVPYLGEHYQPLFAFYRKEILDNITWHLQEDKLKLTGIYPHLRVKCIEEKTIRSFDPLMLSFHNLNTKENYFQAQKLYNLSQSRFILQRHGETNK